MTPSVNSPPSRRSPIPNGTQSCSHHATTPKNHLPSGDRRVGGPPSPNPRSERHSSRAPTYGSAAGFSRGAAGWDFRNFRSGKFFRVSGRSRGCDLMTLVGRYEREKRREMLEKSVARRQLGWSRSTPSSALCLVWLLAATSAARRAGKPTPSYGMPQPRQTDTSNPKGGLDG
jgi:hypothetical protein